MKTITISTEWISEKALAAVLPANGVAPVTINEGAGWQPIAGVEDDRAFRNPLRFSPRYRVHMVVDDDAVEAVFDGISFAYGAGLFSDAEA